MSNRRLARRAARIEAETTATTAAIQQAGSREIATIRQTGQRNVRRLETQANREDAALTVIASMCGAADALPDDFPGRQMAARLAFGTSRFIGRQL